MELDFGESWYINGLGIWKVSLISENIFWEIQTDGIFKEICKMYSLDNKKFTNLKN